MAAQLGRVAAQVRVVKVLAVCAVWLSGCLAVWLSLAVVWLKLGGCLAWWLVAGWLWLVAGGGAGAWGHALVVYGSARETPEYCDFREVSFL